MNVQQIAPLLGLSRASCYMYVRAKTLPPGPYDIADVPVLRKLIDGYLAQVYAQRRDRARRAPRDERGAFLPKSENR